MRRHAGEGRDSRDLGSLVALAILAAMVIALCGVVAVTIDRRAAPSALFASPGVLSAAQFSGGPHAAALNRSAGTEFERGLPKPAR
jgi:hypothetical protein